MKKHQKMYSTLASSLKRFEVESMVVWSKDCTTVMSSGSIQNSLMAMTQLDIVKLVPWSRVGDLHLVLIKICTCFMMVLIRTMFIKVSYTMDGC